ncbi:hypothetical protein RHS01_04468 [Rhizoctonia solani]|uniref:DUF6534 domain-containing protein n=1 Tax=Rhizoctonia solani TaxID=456999 RepID=A0A8H7M5J8_9AGAM|nr:hypothetical protein RHS01_04468 [Rhizoctonia solani]
MSCSFGQNQFLSSGFGVSDIFVHEIGAGSAESPLLGHLYRDLSDANSIASGVYSCALVKEGYEPDPGERQDSGRILREVLLSAAKAVALSSSFEANKSGQSPSNLGAPSIISHLAQRCDRLLLARPTPEQLPSLSAALRTSSAFLLQHSAMTLPPGITQKDVVNAFGPFVTGIMMQQLFLGVFCVQVYDYWRIFPTDTTFNRAVVASLTIMTLLQGVMDYINLYRNAVTYYGDFLMFDSQDWSLFWEIGVTAILGSIAQVFFLERAYSVSSSLNTIDQSNESPPTTQATKSKIVLVVVGTIIAVSLGFGIASSVEFQRIVRLSLVPSIPVPIIGWLTLTAVLDVLISAILIYTLLRVRTPFRKTEAVITKIIRVTMETSSVTASIAVINLVLYLALPGQAYHLLPQLIMGKMYAISVMVTLSSLDPWTCCWPTPQNGVVVTTSYQQNVDDSKGRPHDIELGTRTIDTVRFARTQEETIIDDDESVDAAKRSHHPFAP